MDIKSIHFYPERLNREKKHTPISKGSTKTIHYHLVDFLADIKYYSQLDKTKIAKIFDKATRIDKKYFSFSNNNLLGEYTCSLLISINQALKYYGSSNDDKFCAYIRTKVFKSNYMSILSEECYDFHKEVNYIDFYQNDYDRIVSSSAFRRLQDKAQVFSLESFDYVRTRLTHSNEVSSTSEIIANKILYNYFFANYYDASIMRRMSEFVNICKCSSLLHDIGNPPFGHYGESIIRNYFKDLFDGKLSLQISEHVSKRIGTDKRNVCDIITNQQMRNDFTYFDGNAQAFRIITKLQPYRNKISLNLTASVLRSIIKYPCNSVNQIETGKFGYFYSEEDIINFLRKKANYNDGKMYLPALIMEVSDDISYNISDFEDSIKKGLISYEDLINADISGENACVKKFLKTFDKYYQENKKDFKNPFEVTLSSLIKQLKLKLISEISYILFKEQNILSYLDRKNNNKHLFKDAPSYSICKFIKDKLIKPKVYVSKLISECELEADTILTYLLDEFTKAVLYVDFESDSTSSASCNENVEKYKKIINLISSHIIKSYIDVQAKLSTPEEKLYYRLKIVVDYISGMTDSFAKYTFCKLTGK